MKTSSQVLTISTPVRLTTPGWLDADLSSAVKAGERDSSVDALKEWVPNHLPVPERGFNNDEEVAVLHRVARTRTPEGDERAEYLARYGNDAIWHRHLEQWQQTVGAEQAKMGASLLNAAIKMSTELGREVKAMVRRPRPYVHDPSLRLAVPRPPAESMSWPSGHTCRAYAAATVLSHLMPERKGVFMSDAAEMAFSRVYGGAHYPSDTVAGAWLGSLVGNWMIRTFMHSI